ncbi:MAG: toll/interleukin-1 receptor domain-containing protein [Rhodococcus sp.]|nr:toll/interleukin-1 receptor domain-containing protein [Rhodococcus sp. (in: high G+C Gram-positive bacteria)]
MARRDRQSAQRCDWFVVVLSPDALDSRWVKRELLYALQQDRFEGRIAPLLHRACAYDQSSWTLPQMQTVDFTRSFDRREIRGGSRPAS